MNFQQIISTINIGIVKQNDGLSYHEYCIGISDSGKEAICRRHHLEDGVDWFVVLPTNSLETALSVADYYSLLGMQSLVQEDCHFDEGSLSVFCYKITINSKEHNS